MRILQLESNDRQPGISSRSPDLWLHGHVVRREGDLKERKLGVVSQMTEGKMWLLTLIDRGIGHQRRPRGTSYKFKI